MNNLPIIFFVIAANFLIGLTLSNNLSKDRPIGYEWSVFFIGTFGLLIGVIIVLCSPVGKKERNNSSTTEDLAGIGVMILFALISFIVIPKMASMDAGMQFIAGLFGIGTTGMIIYQAIKMSYPKEKVST